jgi:hypothetical protein
MNEQSRTPEQMEYIRRETEKAQSIFPLKKGQFARILTRDCILVGYVVKHKDGEKEVLDFLILLSDLEEFERDGKSI